MASRLEDTATNDRELYDLHRSSDSGRMSPEHETILYERDVTSKGKKYSKAADIPRPKTTRKTVSYSVVLEKISHVFTKMQEFIRMPTFIAHVQKDAFKMNNIDTQLVTRNEDLKKDSAVIVAGETSAGKSTVINLLIGESKDLLPVDIGATTSRVCRITYSDHIKLSAKDKENKVLEDKEFTAKEENDFATKLRDLATTCDSEVRYIDVCLPVPILKRNIMIVDTPGIGDKEQEDVASMMMEYLPNAVAFVFVLNMGSAGGLQDDRLPRILLRIRQLMKQMHCFDPKDAIFLLNKWDSLVFKNPESDFFEETKRKLHTKWKEVDDNRIIKFAAAKVGKKEKYKREFEKFQNIMKEVITRTENKRIKEHLEFISKFIDECEWILLAKLKIAGRNTEDNESIFNLRSKDLKDIENHREEACSLLRQDIDTFLEETAKDLFDYIQSEEFKQRILSDINKCLRFKIGTEMDTRIERETCDWQRQNMEEMFEKKVVQQLEEKFVNIHKSLEKFKGKMSGLTSPFDVENKMPSVVISFIGPTGTAVVGGFLIRQAFPAAAVPVAAIGLFSGFVISGLVALDVLDDIHTTIEKGYRARIRELTKEKIKESLCEKYAEGFQDIINCFLEGDLKDEIENLRESVEDMKSKVDDFKSEESKIESLLSILSNIKDLLKELKVYDIKFD